MQQKKHAIREQTQLTVFVSFFVVKSGLAYYSVPNRRIGPNKRAGGKILKKY